MNDKELRAALDAVIEQAETNMRTSQRSMVSAVTINWLNRMKDAALAASAPDEGPKSAWQQFDEEWRAEHAASAPDEGPRLRAASERGVRYGYQRGHADADVRRGYREDLAAQNWLTEWDEKAARALDGLPARPAVPALDVERLENAIDAHAATHPSRTLYDEYSGTDFTESHRCTSECAPGIAAEYARPPLQGAHR